MLEKRLLISSLLLVGCAESGSTATLPSAQNSSVSDATALYAANCAACHGAALAGSARGPALDPAVYNASREQMNAVIQDGAVAQGMPAFGETLSDEEIYALIGLIQDFNVEASGGADSTRTEDYDLPRMADTLDYILQAEVFVEGLETPWALAFIDDRTALVTERPGRLRIVRDGDLLYGPVSGTPDVLVSEHEWNQGGLLDVAIDPNYADNGWIYLAFSHRLQGDRDESAERGMTRVVRGRIRGND